MHKNKKMASRGVCFAFCMLFLMGIENAAQAAPPLMHAATAQISAQTKNSASKKSHQLRVTQDRNKIARLSRQGRLDAARAILKPFVDRKQFGEIVSRLDLSTKRNKGYLWSGDKEAFKKIAAHRGVKTLEMTLGGQVVDNWPYLNQKFTWHDGPTLSDGERFWGETSKRYAEGLSGRVVALQTPDKKGGGFIFKKYEYPVLVQLMQKGVVTRFTQEVITPKP